MKNTHMKRNRIGVIAALIGLVGLVACNNELDLGARSEWGAEKDILENVEQYEIKLNNDWLHFPDIGSFEKTIAELEKLGSDEDLDKWESKYEGFNSWSSSMSEEIFDDARATGIDIPDPLLTAVLSKQGRIQIADTVYQVQQEKDKPLLYAIHEKHAVDIAEGVDPAKISAKVYTLGLLILPFPRWQDREYEVNPNPGGNICDFPSSPLFPWWGQKGDMIYNANDGQELQRDNGRNVRIEYHRWRVGFIFYSSAGVRVKIMKHTRLGGWMSTVKMNTVNIQACTKGLIVIPGLLPVPYHSQTSASGNNVNKLERTLKWAAAPLHVEVLPHHFNFKFEANYKGQQVSRFVRE